MSNKSHLCPLDLNSDFECKNIGCILFMIRGNKNYTINMGKKMEGNVCFIFRNFQSRFLINMS